MKTDRLEEFVKSQRSSFDSEEPSPGLFDKIVPEEKTKVVSINWRRNLLRVASAAAIFILAWILNDTLDIRPFGTDNNGGGVITAENSTANPCIEELAEAQVYYTSEINARSTEMISYADSYPEILNDLQTEFAELDSSYVELEKDLMDNVATQEVVEAMIQTYRIKLQILEELLNEFKMQEHHENLTKAEFI